MPLSTIPESYEQSMKSLPEARKHADDVLVYDNTPDGKGHRLVARFVAGELVSAACSVANYAMGGSNKKNQHGGDNPHAHLLGPNSRFASPTPDTGDRG